MNSRLYYFLITIPLLGSGCGADTSTSDESPDLRAAAAQSAAPARPVGFGEQSHGDDAPPDYARVFADDQVQRMDIVMDMETHWSIMNDLTLRT